MRFRGFLHAGAVAILATVKLLGLQTDPDVLPSLTIRTVDTKTVGGTPGGGLIVGQSRCNDNGDVFFRQIQSSRVSASPIIEITKDASRSRFFDFNALNGKDEIKNLLVADFTVKGSNLYMVGQPSDGAIRIIQFSTDEGKSAEVIKLESSSKHGPGPRGELNPTKLAILPNGQFIVIGVRVAAETSPADVNRPKMTYTPVIELYDLAGRLVKSSELKSKEINLNKRSLPQPDNFQPLDLALTANGPDGVYLVSYTKTPTLYVIGQDGLIARKLNLEAPMNDFSPISLQVGGSQILIEYVKSAAEGNAEFAFRTFNSQSGETLATYKAEDAIGVFACFDWRNEFTFVSSNATGQRVLRNGAAR